MTQHKTVTKLYNVKDNKCVSISSPTKQNIMIVYDEYTIIFDTDWLERSLHCILQNIGIEIHDVVKVEHLQSTERSVILHAYKRRIPNTNSIMVVCIKIEELDALVLNLEQLIPVIEYLTI